MCSFAASESTTLSSVQVQPSGTQSYQIVPTTGAHHVHSFTCSHKLLCLRTLVVAVDLAVSLVCLLVVH